MLSQVQQRIARYFEEKCVETHKLTGNDYAWAVYQQLMAACDQKQGPKAFVDLVTKVIGTPVKAPEIPPSPC